MHFYERERIAVFIDGANTHAACRALGFIIDFKRLLMLFRSKGRLVRAYYFTAVIEDAEDEFSSLRPLVDWLDYNGFAMITKPTKQFTDATGRTKIKGDMDVEIAVTALQIASEIDHAVLLTGDGDFAPLVAALQGMGKRVSVVSSLKTNPPMIADELRRQADQFVDLVQLENDISRERANLSVAVPSSR